MAKKKTREIQGVCTADARQFIKNNSDWLRDIACKKNRKRFYCALSVENPEVALAAAQRHKCSVATKEGAVYDGVCALGHHFGPVHAAVVKSLTSKQSSFVARSITSADEKRFAHINSLLMTVYNDCKRGTLSTNGYSSRILAFLKRNVRN